MHGLYFFYFSSYYSHLNCIFIKMKPLRLFMNSIIKNIDNFYLAIPNKCHLLIDFSFLKDHVDK